MHGAQMWKSVLGFEGLYEASNEGEVRSVDRIVIGRALPGKLRKIRICKCGYREVSLSKHGRVKRMRVARIVAEAWHGERPKGLQIAHLNGIRTDDRPENLAFVTAKENTGHKVEHGTLAKGSKVGTAKLTEEKVAEIKSLHRPRTREFGCAALARRYGVARITIVQIVYGHSWQHVEAA